MASELSSRCDAFTLTVQEPESGSPPTLTGRVVFADDAGTRSVDIQLALFARMQRESLGPDEPRAETAVAGCSTTVERATGPVAFSLELPPVASTWVGKELRADLGIVARGDDGSQLRNVIELPLLGRARRLILRGMPKQVSFTPPDRFFMGVTIALLGAAALAVGASTGGSGMYAIGAVAVAFGTVLAGLAFRRARGRLLLGNAKIRLESGGAEGRELAVTVTGVARTVKGRAGLRAVESERSTGPQAELSELLSRWIELGRREDGALVATIPLPEPADAPPSLSFSRAARVIAFRWLVEVELENAGGFRDRASLPVHVGIERT